MELGSSLDLLAHSLAGSNVLYIYANGASLCVSDMYQIYTGFPDNAVKIVAVTSRVNFR